MKRTFHLVLLLFLSICSKSQVNLQTGESVFSFPLYSYSDAANRLQLPIGLQYRSGGGIKTNYIASNVGTGWMLSVGGEISRTVVGHPDDQKYVSSVSPDNYLLHPQKITTSYFPYKFYPDGYLYSEYSADDNLTNYSTYTPIIGRTTLEEVGKSKYDDADRQQDIFHYSFNGRSGSFVIGKDWTVRPIQDCGLKFSLSTEDMSTSYIRTRIKSFTITDEAGIVYHFAEKELLHTMSYSTRFPSEAPVFNSETSVVAVRYKPIELASTEIRKVVSKWFLTKIENPLTNQAISFNYDNEIVDYFGPKHISGSQYRSPNSLQFLFERIKVETKRLTSVLLNSYETYTFEYSSLPRVDLPGDYALTKVRHVRNNIVVSGFELKYGYLFKNELKPYDFSFSNADKRFARLALTEINSIGNNNTNKIEAGFEYYLSISGVTTICPPQFSLDIDGSGYYNKGSNPSSGNEYDDGGPRGDCYFKNGILNIGQQSIGLLKSITNGMGGRYTYEYEQNRSRLSTTNPNTVAVNPGVRVKNYKTNDGVGESVIEYKYVDENGFSSRWGEEASVNEDELTIRQYIVPGNDYRVSFSLGGSLLFGFNMGRIGSPLYYLQNNEYATTIVGLAGVWGQVFAPLVDLVLSFFTDPYKDVTAYRWFNTNRNLANLLPAQYKIVEVHPKGTGTGNIGKTVYAFTSDSEYPALVPQLLPPFSQKLRAVPWLYGLPLSEKVYDAAGNLRKKVNYSYGSHVALYEDANNKSAAYYSDFVMAAELSASIGYNGFGSTPITKEVYYPYHGRAELEEVKSTIYDDAGGYSEDIVRYGYNSVNFMLSSTERDLRSGVTEGENVYYTVDYSLSGVLSDMKSAAKNMTAVPVARSSWIKASNGLKYLKGLEINKFDYVGNGDIKQVETFGFNADEAIQTSEFVTSLPSGTWHNFTYVRSIGTTAYAANGNVSKQESNGKKKALIYDPVDKNAIIAEVINADEGSIAYTSFESSSTTKITYNSNSVVNTSFLSGAHSYKISENNSTISVQVASAPSLLSFWVKGELPVVVAVPANTPISPYFNESLEGTDWKLVKFNLPSTSVVEIRRPAVFTSIYLDEVRVHPTKASMNTFCYDDRGLKISEVNMNSIVTRYEYDDLARLSIIRDEKGNILRRICYSYAGQSEACAVYYNSEKSQVFTKDCGCGQTSPSYNYIVPANKYVASTKEAADNLALAEISAQGQVTANAEIDCPPPPSVPPVYARLEIEQGNFYDNSYGNFFDYYETVALYVRFYSDCACTIPYSTTLDFDYTINSFGYVETHEGFSPFELAIYSGSISSGTNSFFFDDTLLYYSFMGEYDDVLGWTQYEKIKEDFFLSPSTQYIIRPTIRSVNYPNGF